MKTKSNEYNSICIFPNSAFLMEGFYDVKTFAKLIYVLIYVIKMLYNNYRNRVFIVTHTSVDLWLAKLIFRKLKDKKVMVDIINCDDLPLEVLWNITRLQCRIPISMLAHPVMAFLSICRPVLGLSYSHKLRGIMKLFEVEKLFIELNKPNLYSQLLNLVIQVLDDYSNLSKKLCERYEKLMFLIKKFERSIEKTLFNIKK